MIPYLDRLGQRIEQEWVKLNYSEDAFPELVQSMLDREPPADHIRYPEIRDWIFGPHHSFQQPVYRRLFGEPPIMLFQAPRFYIEALFWFSATTAIHEHSFSGVFSVLAGSSVHSHWSFETTRVVNSRMLCGDLKRISTEILRPGGTRAIRSGDRLIHQLFHLEVPSVTLVIRTYEDRDHLPQYKYLPPGLAVDAEGGDSLRNRRLMFLEAMASGRMEGLRESLLPLIDQGDLESLFYVFSMLDGRKLDPELLEEFYGAAGRRHGDIIDLFRKVCENERRTRIVTALRSKISDPDGRFFLALLMLMPDRDAIFEAIRLQYPESDPIQRVEEWLETMSGSVSIGFNFDDTNRLIVRGLLKGLEIEPFLQDLEAEFRQESVSDHREKILDHARKIAKLDLLNPLFSRSPLQWSEEALIA